MVPSDDLIQKILAIPSETRVLEFKQLGARNEGLDRTLESIVAMANTDGGLIFIGVEDPEKSARPGMTRISGIEQNLELYDELAKAVRNISPPIPHLWNPDLVTVPTKNVRIALLRVPKVEDEFRSINNHVYTRLEKGNKRLSPQEIVHMAYVKGFRKADTETVDVDTALLQTPAYEAWRTKRNLADEPINDVLMKTGLVRRVDGQVKPTRAAVLLFAEHPSDLMETKCVIRVFQYEGSLERVKDTLNLIGIPKTIEGSIVRQIRDAHEYILGLLSTGIKVPSGFVTTYKIPERAVKEAITNAVIHRDYHTKHDIEVRIFEDRVETESPGLLPFNITPSNIGLTRALGYRNDLLVKHLREFPEPPNLDQNEGVRAMRQTMLDANLYPPIFVTYPHLQDSVRVVLLNESTPSEWDKISAYLTRNKYIANSEARALLHVDDTVKVSKLFGKWVRLGLLKRIEPRSGAKRNVKYRLPATDETTLFTTPKSK
ncbi:MAG: RNA-binding domain-containing protein [Patescibacteria group bacterium]